MISFIRAPRPKGPGNRLVKVPEEFYQVGPTYFKTAKIAGKTRPYPQPRGKSVTPPKAKIIDIPRLPPARPPRNRGPPLPAAPNRRENPPRRPR